MSGSNLDLNFKNCHLYTCSQLTLIKFFIQVHPQIAKVHHISVFSNIEKTISGLELILEVLNVTPTCKKVMVWEW